MLGQFESLWKYKYINISNVNLNITNNAAKEILYMTKNEYLNHNKNQIINFIMCNLFSNIFAPCPKSDTLPAHSYSSV